MADITHRDYPTEDEKEKGYPTDDELGGIGGIDWGEDRSSTGWVWFNILKPLLLFFFGWAVILFHWSEPRLSFVAVDEVRRIRAIACVRATSFIALLVMANLVFGHKQPWLEYFIPALACLVPFGFFSFVQHEGPTYEKPTDPPQSVPEQIDFKALVDALTGIPIIAMIFLVALWGVAEGAAQLVLHFRHLLS